MHSDHLIFESDTQVRGRRQKSEAGLEGVPGWRVVPGPALRVGVCVCVVPSGDSTPYRADAVPSRQPLHRAPESAMM